MIAVAVCKPCAVQGIDTASATFADELRAFQTATRDLVGIALRSLEVAAPMVSLPQMRLLLALEESDRTPSARLAESLGVAASSVTRMADRLVAAGYVRRGGDPYNRSVVTLELSASGRRVGARSIHLNGRRRIGSQRGCCA